MAKGTRNIFNHTHNTPLAYMVSHRCYMAVASGAIPSTGKTECSRPYTINLQNKTLYLRHLSTTYITCTHKCSSYNKHEEFGENDDYVISSKLSIQCYPKCCSLATYVNYRKCKTMRTLPPSTSETTLPAQNKKFQFFLCMTPSISKHSENQVRDSSSKSKHLMIKIAISWIVTLYILGDMHSSFRGFCCFHLLIW